jgi:hypothetical protein
MIAKRDAILRGVEKFEELEPENVVDIRKIHGQG